MQGQKNYLHFTDIPAQLSSLNSIERRLISQVHPYMKLILLPFRQSAMNGQVINFPYEVEDMLHQTKFRNKIIVVQTESNKSIPKEYVADLSKVKKAIAWLKNHNSLYSHYNVKHFDTQPAVLTLDSSKDDPDLNEETIDFTESSLAVDKPGLPKVDFNKEVTGSSSKGADKYVLSLNRNHPLNTFTKTSIEELAFPYLFPSGRNGLHAIRRYLMSHLQYFQTRLLSSDRRFSSNLPYLFWATNITKKQMLGNNISVALRKRNSGSSFDHSELRIDNSPYGPFWCGRSILGTIISPL